MQMQQGTLRQARDAALHEGCYTPLTPRCFSASKSLALCVLLPQRSAPSNKMNAPRGMALAAAMGRTEGKRHCLC